MSNQYTVSYTNAEDRMIHERHLPDYLIAKAIGKSASAIGKRRKHLKTFVAEDDIDDRYALIREEIEALEARLPVMRDELTWVLNRLASLRKVIA
jgi:hypothetical protein